MTKIVIIIIKINYKNVQVWVPRIITKYYVIYYRYTHNLDV